jgi:hypothetical protein
MKKLFLILTLVIVSLTAFAQQPTNLGWSTNPLPPYAPQGTGTSISYSYLHAAVPSSTHDTLRVATLTTIATIDFDSINGFKTTPTVIMADTTGDTASYSNYPTGKATVWYKKNPFLFNHQCDALHFIFHGNQTKYSTVKFGAMFQVTLGLNAADTLHIPLYVKSTGAGGAKADFKYDSWTNRWIYQGSTQWFIQPDASIMDDYPSTWYVKRRDENLISNR